MKTAKEINETMKYNDYNKILEEIEHAIVTLASRDAYEHTFVEESQRGLIFAIKRNKFRERLENDLTELGYRFKWEQIGFDDTFTVRW